MRVVQNFNRDWCFSPAQAALDAPDTDFAPVTLPHTNKLFSQHFVDHTAYQFISTYRKRFTVEADLAGQRVFIDFDGAMIETTVYLNGALLGVHQGGFTPFSFDITAHLVAGENVLTVYVDSRELAHIPPYGTQVDYVLFGGLYRDVYLRVVDVRHITDVFAQPHDVLTAPRLDVDVKLAGWAAGLALEAVLTDAQGVTVATQRRPAESADVRVSFPGLTGIRLWTLDAPALYTLTVTLTADGEPCDAESVRVGFRSACFSSDGSFYLNGEPLKLFGLNRHQTYPYIGAAAPASLQRHDADVMKYELACNVARTSHYPQSPHFLDRCDEIGLLVFEEIPGWHHIGDAAWQALALRDVRAMIERDRNHPSVILWGVRINESGDDEGLYGETNALARLLDPTRQTGGVRDFIQSSFLEDVFTLNDFPEGLQTPLVTPHLITEFVGHMFPTKTWDNEGRRIEHALRHARKHDLQLGHPDIAGGIGWCAFDYHTHKEFGSGDRVCYHGVMDIYRLPKMAAHFYRSQKSPADEIVLHAATNWTMGDRSGGGNNPLVVFSNCEEVEIFIDGESYGRIRPAADEYPHLPHPPFIVRWPLPYNPWGNPFEDLMVRGYIGGEIAAEQRIDSGHVPHRLRITASAERLIADGADMARIAVQVEDKYGNVLPYQMRAVTFEVTGDADLVGDNPHVLLGGQGACYLKARGTAGSVTVRATVHELPSAEVVVQIAE